MNRISRLNGLFMLLSCFILGGGFSAWAQNMEAASQTKVQELDPGLTLAGAVICEDVKGYKPHNQTIAISTSLGKAICYTSFDPVPEKTIIYHNWYRLDVLSTAIRLELQPPRWATFSTIQFREADKGPWRVEIADQDGRIFKILRFSITD